MFQELMPLLAKRRLMLFVNRMDAGTIRLNVIPQALKDSGERDEALATPLSITGTPEDLDRELPRQLVEFVAAHLGLSSTLESVKRELEASAKKARESTKKTTSTASAKHSVPSANSETTPIGTHDAGSGTEANKDGATAEVATTTPSLFANDAQ